MEWEIPAGWSHAWEEEEKYTCKKCGSRLITIGQSCGNDCTQYEIRCVKCGNLEGSHYED